MKVIVYIIILILFSGCGSVVKVDSEPREATVYVKEGQRLQKIGQTPLNLDHQSFSHLKSFQLRIEKEGYQPQEMLVDNRGLGVTSEIFTTMEPLQNTKDGGERETEGTALSKAVSIYQAQQHRGLASIQSHLNASEYLQAEVSARQFVSDNPFSSVGWALLGNAYYLQNKSEKALDAYKKSFEYDPENVNVQKIIDYLSRNTPTRSR
jgi:tetratricopeptide (TPR) repeat protein